MAFGKSNSIQHELDSHANGDVMINPGKIWENSTALKAKVFEFLKEAYLMI